jgi:hypothetical protein
MSRRRIGLLGAATLALQKWQKLIPALGIPQIE